MTIEYFKKAVYGIDKLYVKDEEKAKLIYMLTGRKTLSAMDIVALTALGFDLIQVLN